MLDEILEGAGWRAGRRAVGAGAGVMLEAGGVDGVFSTGLAAASVAAVVFGLSGMRRYSPRCFR